MPQRPIPRSPVRSSNLHSVGYDNLTKNLDIRFKENGTVYRYAGVPDSMYAGLMDAKSKGEFHHNFIKGKFRTTIV